ncbi:MAG TPA: hypothetical protein VLT58_01260 [Polyangia bacterium]|nr:hypothetical protein [Polyangia bacterium]
MGLPSNFVDEPPDKLVVALQFWAGDEQRAMRLARLIADVEPRRRDDVIVAFCRRFDTPETELTRDTFLYVGAKFGVIRVRSEREAVDHPDGCFGLWAGTLDALSEGWLSGQLRAHSVLTIEADGCPLRRDWLDVVLSEHRRTLDTGKRITGPLMERPMPHINGTLAAHLSLWIDRTSLRRCPPNQAWDLFHAAVLMAEARPTNAIRNIYGACRWAPESLAVLAKETAWLSSQKDDSALGWAERTLVAR